MAGGEMLVASSLSAVYGGSRRIGTNEAAILVNEPRRDARSAIR